MLWATRWFIAHAWLLISRYLYDALFVFDYLLSAEHDNLFSCLIVYFLCRLKINHDSHEFFSDYVPKGVSTVGEQWPDLIR
jgi:hypothetical protein